MNPDELVWRIEEDEELLRECEEAGDNQGCELIKARLTALKNDLKEEIAHPTLGRVEPRGQVQ